jgi:hypothetical protein
MLEGYRIHAMHFVGSGSALSEMYPPMDLPFG